MFVRNRECRSDILISKIAKIWYTYYIIVCSKYVRIDSFFWSKKNFGSKFIADNKIGEQDEDVHLMFRLVAIMTCRGTTVEERKVRRGSPAGLASFTFYRSLFSPFLDFIMLLKAKTCKRPRHNHGGGSRRR